MLQYLSGMSVSQPQKIMACDRCPSLPNEIWLQILENLTADEDLPTLWRGRQVSTTFKDVAESIFKDRCLPHTTIQFDLGTFVPDTSDSEEELQRENYRPREHNLIAPFHFSSLSEDGSRAIFAVDSTSLTEDLHPKARPRLRYDLSQSIIEEPKHFVQIRREVNDGPIPGCSMDSEKLELSCNWRELYAAFYNEEYLYHKFTAKALEKRGPWLEELKKKVDRGQLDPMAVMTKALTAFADDSKDCRKLARRARICWQFKKHDGTEWDFGRDGDEETERNCLAELQNIRHFSSMEVFSDEESGEDDDGEDEGSDLDEDEDEDEQDEEWADTDSDDDA